MQHRNLFVFDIQTIPDTNSVTALTGFDESETDARRAELERYHLEAVTPSSASHFTGSSPLPSSKPRSTGTAISKHIY
jgi:hypothetical protein